MSVMAETGTLELVLAEELVDALAPEQMETREEKERILVRIRKRGWKLSRIVFSKASLRKLADDRHREIKLEYLGRDIERTAARRATYTYPRRFAV